MRRPFGCVSAGQCVAVTLESTFEPALTSMAPLVSLREFSLTPAAEHRNRDGNPELGLFQINHGDTLQCLNGTRGAALSLTWNINAR